MVAGAGRQATYCQLSAGHTNSTLVVDKQRNVHSTYTLAVVDGLTVILTYLGDMGYVLANCAGQVPGMSCRAGLFIHVACVRVCASSKHDTCGLCVRIHKHMIHAASKAVDVHHQPTCIRIAGLHLSAHIAL